MTSTPDSGSTSKPKIHGESTALGWHTTAVGSESGDSVGSTGAGFGSILVPITTIREVKTSIEVIEIRTNSDGSTVTIGPWNGGSVLTTEQLTVHWESSVPGWDFTSSWLFKSSATAQTPSSSMAAHPESTANDWQSSSRQGLPEPESTSYTPVEASDDPWTPSVQTPQATAPARPEDDQAPVTTIPNKVVTDFPPPPAITHGGVTIQPIALTHKPIVTAPDGSLTTTDEVEFQIPIGSSTLSIGTPITINNVVVSLTTDAAGSTVLYVGDLTTTLPKPSAGELRTVAGNAPERLNIATSIVNGTTKYVLAGQTLAPGQPVTLGNTPISIAFNKDGTILYVGDKTKTLSAADVDLQTMTDWPSISVETQNSVANTRAVSASSTSTSSDSSCSRSVYVALEYCAMGIMMFLVAA
ncbi:hypothetical protein OPT61_g4360 [Boeremia exigua]|uniref:Uncharacterized protein n=1 Tax=Boeremia exigua TaxID=749465 RepID=A0ACC2IEK1_9PLEO|nr:hypothetical protein OPT61_g4360 [Boeremia exigua]